MHKVGQLHAINAELVFPIDVEEPGALKAKVTAALPVNHSRSSRTSELTMHACRAQRGSVIATDAVLISGAWYATRREREPRRSLAFFLVVANAGLLLVDHIHFQYNGLLLGELQHLFNGLLLGKLQGCLVACCWVSLRLLTGLLLGELKGCSMACCWASSRG